MFVVADTVLWLVQRSVQIGPRLCIPAQYQSSVVHGPTLSVVCLGVIVMRCICLCTLKWKNVFFFVLSIWYIGIFVIGVIAAIAVLKVLHIKQKAHCLSFAFVDGLHIEFGFSCFYVLARFIVASSIVFLLSMFLWYSVDLPTFVVVAVMSVSLPVPLSLSLSF